MSNKKTQTDFNALEKELEEINDWFETEKESNLELAMSKYKRGVEIVKILKGHLQDVENEFNKINQEFSEE